MQNSPWQINDNQAALAVGDLSALVDLTRPGAGLTELRLNGKALAGNALGVSIENAGQFDAVQQSREKPEAEALLPAEAYVRGNDLIVTYEATKLCPVRFQIYWRAVSTGSATAPTIVEAIVSVQTPLLETYPGVAVSTSLNAEQYDYVGKNGRSLLTLSRKARDWEFERFAETGVALASLGDLGSYAEMAHPEDFLGWLISRNDSQPSWSTAWKLSDQFMEKGVIRRLRTRGLFYRRTATEAELLAQLRQLANEEPPLTV